MLPADEGDSFFVETGEPRSTHRMLIDGGRLRTAGDILWPFIQKLQPRDGRPALDLVVLTHIDLDHIEGLLALLTRADPPAIGEIWFNDYPQVRAASGKRPLPTAPRSSARPTDVLGVRQAKVLAAVIDRNCWPLNAAFAGGAVLLETSGNLPTVNLASGAILTLLGPTRVKLAAFESEWGREIAKLELHQEAEDALAARARPVPAPGLVEGLARLRDKADDRKPNGTSIAFVIQYRGRRALFLADAHPDDMAKNIVRYGGANGRVSFNAIKVSHHGSAANNTSQLIDLLESPLWLVSSSGSYHQHPDPEAISENRPRSREG